MNRHSLIMMVILLLVLGWSAQRSYAGHMMGGGMMGGGMMMQPSERDDLRELPESKSEAAQLFRHYCGQCHAPPAPSVHTASEWPGVVARMKQHMATQGVVEPKDDDIREVLDYLQRHAK